MRGSALISPRERVPLLKPRDPRLQPRESARDGMTPHRDVAHSGDPSIRRAFQVAERELRRPKGLLRRIEEVPRRVRAGGVIPSVSRCLLADLHRETNGLTAVTGP
jgi:hypothetical protein